MPYRFQVAQQLYPFETAKSALYRIRRDLPLVRNFGAIDAILQRDDWVRLSQHDHATLRRSIVYSPAGAQALILGDPRLADTLQVNHLFISLNTGTLPVINSTSEVMFILGEFDHRVRFYFLLIAIFFFFLFFF